MSKIIKWLFAAKSIILRSGARSVKGGGAMMVIGHLMVDLEN